MLIVVAMDGKIILLCGLNATWFQCKSALLILYHIAAGAMLKGIKTKLAKLCV